MNNIVNLTRNNNATPRRSINRVVNLTGNGNNNNRRHRPAALPSQRRQGTALNAAAAAAAPGWLQTRFGQFELQPHQVNVSKLFARPGVPGVLLYFKVGSGKTLASIAAVENLARREGRRRNVIVAVPASLVANYRKELQAAGVDASKYYVASYEKIHSLRTEVEKLFNATANRSNVNDTVEAQLRLFAKDAVLVIDEVQNLRNPESRMLDTFLHVAKGAHKRLLLSGTPVMNYPKDIGAYMGLVNPRLIPRVVKREETLQTPAGPVVKVAYPFERVFGREANQNVAELDEMMRCTTLFYEPGPAIVRQHYPTKTEHWVAVPLSPQQTRRQFELDVNAPASLDMEDILDGKVSISFLSAPRQINNRLGNYHPKLDECVRRVVQEVARGGRCVVYDFFLDYGLAPVARQLAAWGVSLELFTGQTKTSEKNHAVARYNAGDVSVILLSSAGGEGLDLKNTSQVHILQPWWNDEVINQVIGRAVRYKSHTGPSRHVDVFRYLSTFPANRDRFLPAGKTPGDMGVLYDYTADEICKFVSERKRAHVQAFLDRLVRISDQNLAACLG